MLFNRPPYPPGGAAARNESICVMLLFEEATNGSPAKLQHSKIANEVKRKTREAAYLNQVYNSSNLINPPSGINQTLQI